ncbi:methyltransferase family protein [Pseudothermotoga sp.]|nr:isoprenylcysteine carboxylmethyltransferase family protein [Pseudothermotoga sp.]MCX7813745.1 isoprenylcysteine carboxylmethyltransferase family protein [Pseudothermotoga sp.]MDW8140443.1 isoprenylcysteine carboxylmethyltransferase family protein [Pseudothermotoga sp.]
MKLAFWLIVFAWWIMDFYVLVLKRNEYHKVLDKKSKFIMTVLISLGVILAISPESFRNTWRSREFGFYQILGTIVLCFGVILRFIAILTLGKNFSADIVVAKERKLVYKGIYRYIRHPSYTGEIISFLGLAIVFQHVPSSIFIFVFPAIAFVHRALVEEKKLMEEFGEEYLNYRRRTRMFI